MIDVYSLAMEDTRLGKESVHSLAGPCPSPDCNRKTNGFYIKWSGSEWCFGCRGCWEPSDIMPNGRKRGLGDTISYLRHYRKMSYQQARALVDGQEGVSYIPEQQVGYKSDEWQKKTHEAMQAHIDRLWSDDTTALDYVRSRGLHDGTIRQFQLGYSLYKGIPRLLIPSINDNQYVTIYRRDLRPGISQDQRWKDAPGGTKRELYLADSLKLRKELPVILVEDAFSAMSIWQEVGDIINPVATGSANCGQLIKWIARLVRMPRVLIALDADEAGDEQSTYWLDRLANAQRLRPLLKDPNDMLQADYNLREWITAGLAEAWNELCSVCGIDLNTIDTGAYDINSVAFCNYDPETKEAYCSRQQAEVPTRSTSLDGVTIGTGTYTLDNHLARLEQEEQDKLRMQQLSSRRRRELVG